MSKLDELIAELCPNGVEYKLLEDIAQFRRGSFPQPYGNSSWYGGEDSMPFVQVADVSDYGFCLNSETKQQISKVAQQHSIFVEVGTVIVSLQGTIGRVAITQYDCYVDRTLAIFKNYKVNVNKKYFAYQLKAKFDIEKKTARGSTLKTITKEEFSKFEIPIPPLSVQEEIVRILDNFTELTAELTADLTAELTARKQQYEYYRDKLLTQSEDAPIVALKTVVKKSCSGGTPTKGNSDYYENGTIPWLRTQDVKFNEIYEINSFITEEAVKKTSAKWIPANCVIVAISGATAGRCAINKIATTTNQHCLNMEIDNTKALYKYIYYCVCSQYEELISRKQGARGDLNSTLIMGIEIPLPTLKEQEHIVAILERFDTIVNEITQGLPAEIEARQKQYEYYRDKLLTFKEIEK